MSIRQLNLAGLNMVEVAIARLREFEPSEGYYLAFSGGKDSITAYSLAEKSGVKFVAHYSDGGLDPPELRHFIRDIYPDTIIDKPFVTVWQGIQKKGMPRRQNRWCCELIKEKHGTGGTVLTGIRWEESPRRAKRQMTEVCRTDKTKIFVHPIIDWSSKDVWEYIRQERLSHCSLYDEGFKRLGCVLCPMKTARQTEIELIRFPKLSRAWKIACYKYWEKGTPGVKRWDTPEAFWQWWLSRTGEPKVSDAQCIMFDN